MWMQHLVQRPSRAYEAGRPYGLRLPRPLDICIRWAAPPASWIIRLAPLGQESMGRPQHTTPTQPAGKGPDMTSPDGRRASQASATPSRNISDLSASGFSFRQVAPCSGRSLHGHSLPRYTATEIPGTPARTANARSGVRKPRWGTNQEPELVDNIPFCQRHGRRTRAPAPRPSRIR